MTNVTMAEIESQPKIWQEIITNDTERKLNSDSGYFKKEKSNAIFIGCGTSFYLAQSAAAIYSAKTNMHGRAATASDAMLFPELVYSTDPTKDRPFLISRSGTTTEILLAADYISSYLPIESTGISCRPKSDLISKVKHALLTPEADEESVVMTRSFTSMLLKVQMLVADIAEDAEYLDELSQLPRFGSILLQNYKGLIPTILDDNQISKFIYLGQGPFYGLANESMLKIKEMSLSHSEAYHSLEFRHGPKSIVDGEMLITLFFSNNAYEREIKLLEEIKSLGGITFSICDKASEDIFEYSDYVVELNSGLSDYARMILYMPVTQLLGYHTAINKDLNPDQPTNLTQVVTL